MYFVNCVDFNGMLAHILPSFQYIPQVYNASCNGLAKYAVSFKVSIDGGKFSVKL